MTALPRIPLPCTSDPTIFFPPEKVRGAQKPSYAYPQDAKHPCASCPARIPCLEVALRTTDVGVWGGTTDDERDTIRKGKQPRIIPTPHVPNFQLAGKPRHNLGGPEDPRHGKENTYSHLACRCPACTQAHTLAKAGRRERDRGAA